MIGTVFFNVQVFAQFCSTAGSEDAYERMMDLQNDDDVSGPFYLRVYRHTIRHSNGSGGQSKEDVDFALNLLSYTMLPQNIFLIPECDISYIDSDALYGIAKSLACYVWENNHSDGIDIYFDGPNADSVGGVAMDIGSSAFIVAGTWKLNPVGFSDTSVIKTNVVAHELGHCLGLFHTHHGNVYESDTTCEGDPRFDPNQAPSLVGDTIAPYCKQTGDYICDTRPDPGIGFYVNSDCEWLATLSEYDPDTHNNMSYTNPQCMSYFEGEQGKIMRKAINSTAVLQQCVINSERTVVISSDSLWTEETVPHDGDFFVRDTLIVLSGNSFTIDSNVTIKFAEDAVLIIEPNAELHLYGTLTSLLPCKGWQGVKVYGNGEENQYLDFQEGVYHHGALYGYPGSLIENAETGVELWGPDPEDTGGRILCTETEFKNNAVGVSFLPYENFKGSQPHPYIARFKECTFLVDDGFNLPVFYQHVSLYGVDGLRFTGCRFGNISSSVDYESQHEYGYGIAAVDAGFIVSASTVAPENPEPCLPGPGGCTVLQRSVFKGLGYGIWTGSIESNRIFRVYQADFEDCYTGIEVDGVSGGLMLFNEFDMGTVPDPDIMDGDQVGIKLNQQLAGFAIEENTFTESSGNTNNTIGIAAENLGEMNTVIRKNTFSGLTIANEAFGVNAGEDQLGIIGLRYICNINTTISDKDFFVKSTEYGTDKISALQAGIASDGSSIATGNQFSSTGDQDDGDFANYGVQIAEYHYYASSPVQVPDDIEGIGNTEEAQQNSCSQEYCAPPCLSSNDLADLSDEYFEYLDFYEDFLNESEWSKAAVSKAIMDQASLLIVQHYFVDSTSFHRDSLQAWYARILTVSGDILLAKDYASEGDYTTARQVLANMSARFSLTTAVEDDIADIDTIFGMLDARGLQGLTQGDIDDLVGFSENEGHSASMARSLLMLNGYRFETQYVLPDPDPEPFIWLSENSVPSFETVTVYPNPVNDDLINITIPEHSVYKTITIEISNIIGQKVAKWSLSEYHNSFKLPSGHDVLMYRISGDGQELKTGRIFSFR
ncbi:MAG TPA: hypothetical protein VI603_09605 [Saprospiraceae bacterium]|nr:hypothetical protein [Saprospiraceae bacterium]